MNTKMNFLFIILFFLASCSKEEQKGFEVAADTKISNGIVIGEYDDDLFNVLTLDLGNEICIITRDFIRIVPYDTTQQPYKLSGTFYGAVANEYDTIIQDKNTFYRFYPSKRKFEYLYTPPFTIHDFCVTPNHGIGYVWGNIFVEHQKFNYFSLETLTNETLFELQSFFPEGTYPNRILQTYIKNDNLYLLYGTGEKYEDEGVFFNINLDNIEIENRLKYNNKAWLKILNFNDFENIDISFNPTQNYKGASTFNFITGSEKNRYSFSGSAWWSSKNLIKGDNISISYFNYNTSQKIEFINWKNNLKHFVLSAPEDYINVYSQVYHSDNNQLLLYNQEKGKAILYNQKGKITHSLRHTTKYKNIVYMDDKKVIAICENSQLVLNHL